MKNVECVNRLKSVDKLYWLSRKSIDAFAIDERVINLRKRSAPRFDLKLVEWDYDRIKHIVHQCAKRRLLKPRVLGLKHNRSALLNDINRVDDKDLYKLPPHKTVAFRALKNEWCNGRYNMGHLKTLVCMLDEGDLDDFVYSVLEDVGSESSDSDDENQQMPRAGFFEPVLIKHLRNETVNDINVTWSEVLESVGRYCIAATQTTLQSLFIALVDRLNNKPHYSKLEFLKDLKNGLIKGDRDVGSYLDKPPFRTDTCYRFILEFETAVRDGGVFS